MRAGDTALFPLIHNYLKIYLPKQRNASPNTLRSYRKALEELLDYVKEQEQISLGSITFEHLTANTIFATLDKGKHINNNKMDCQPYRKRRPAMQKGGVFAWQRKEENVPRYGEK